MRFDINKWVCTWFDIKEGSSAEGEPTDTTVLLKPCPFCGGEAVLDVVEPHPHGCFGIPDYPGGFFVECTRCSCVLSGEDVPEAVRLWNRRVD